MRSGRCPATVLPFGGEPGRLICISEAVLGGRTKFLETFSASKDLPAVKNHCFLTLSYDEVTPSPRNAQAVAAIARWLHPSAFGRPADGS